METSASLERKSSAKQDSESALSTMPEEKESLSQVKSDWPPLHVAAMHGDSQTMNTLLRKGVNLLQKDSQGFTAIHRLLGTEDAKSQTTRILLASDQLEECKVQSIGLTHLHVASWLNNAKAVQRLLEQGSDIEATMERVIEDKNLAKFAGCTPLHIAMMHHSIEAVKELLQWGADIFAKKPDSTSPLSQALTGVNEKILNLFMLLLWSDDELQRSMETRESGLTMLHVACHALDTKKVRTLLKNGVDVNAKTRDDSNVWPGCTALHVLMRRADKLGRWSVGSNKERKRYNIVFDLLLANGADMTVIDERQCTPLQVVFEGLAKAFDLKHSVLKHHRDFQVNPTDNLGLSYFHLACLTNDLVAVEKFLQQGSVDVNRPIDSNSSVHASSTPLNLALKGIRMRRYIAEDKDGNFQLHVVESLLSHGAKISLKDSEGDTPLHNVIQFLRGTKRISLMRKLLSLTSATDVNIRNTSGKTPMALLLVNGAEVEEIKLLLDHGGCINACNPTTNEGYIALVFSRWRYDEYARKAILSMILKSAELSKLDEMGRNAIHNTVSADNVKESLDNLASFITELIKLGCDIDHQDNFGKTALHLAVPFRNINTVHSLIILGADFNVVDSSGKSAFSYVFEPAINPGNYQIVSEQVLVEIFIFLIETCKVAEIEVSGLNSALQIKAIHKYGLAAHSIVKDSFFNQLRATENVKVGRRELTLRSFLCETGAISIFPSIAPAGREEIAVFLENIDNIVSFYHVIHLIRLQYRKAVKRLDLVSPAKDALKILYRFPLPDLCVHIVLMYLSNSDLKSLIAASIDGDDTQMTVDE